MLLDTHCHLDLPPLVQQLDYLLEQARSVGVGQWVVPGVTAQGWAGILDLCQEIGGALPAYGIHPEHAWCSTEQQLATLEQYACQAVAIGEIGLDNQARDMQAQQHLFRAQIRLARAKGLPVLIHCRGSIGRLLDILREERAEQVGGIMHAFAGSVESARECIKLGFAIALSGTLTWDGAQRAVKLAQELPLEHLVVETDAPDLAPQAHRGQHNQPAWLIEVVKALADSKGMHYQELIPALTANAYRVLRLS